MSHGAHVLLKKAHRLILESLHFNDLPNLNVEASASTYLALRLRRSGSAFTEKTVAGALFSQAR